MPSSSRRPADNSILVAEAALEELLKRHESEQAMDELEMQLELRDKFFSLVAHDLRTPLTTANVCAQMLECQLSDPAAARVMVRRITDSLSRAERLISNLLDANRLHAGLPILLQPQKSGDIGETARTCVDHLAPIHRGRCSYDGGDGLHGPIDSNAVSRALENLIINALKYGDESSPIRVVAVRECDTIRLSVKNEGPVLEASELESLFRWHGRSSRHESSAKPGWGLGLMLVKGIAEAHGGSVAVESTLQGGTVFTLMLPASANG